ncbi:TRMT1-like protein [Mercenaria mercenaria]|uniref:TRMT1-like protein n=1 Tax=Mercenaria mercenaria TaxID=6596 RepID=UPI00234F28F4|nr:TRMT1-like protein [Mercenaria mercenaria]XP_045171344.2 TRMT1-like protein [Mercenaria mercenaria]XP_053375311.1 TRMT1-like protein [Mercenaria mercenaria]
MPETVVENGVQIEIPEGLKPSEQVKYYNPRLAILREAILATLKIETDNVDKQLQCLDAFSGSGITGLQWKLHLGDKVHVVLSEGTQVKTSCALNEIQQTDWLLDPSHIPGQLPAEKQNKQEVHVCPYKTNVVLHEEAFNFVFLQQLFNHIALYTDSVFSNLRHNGIACFLIPNMTSPCFRSPKLIQRLYNAHTQKTEYVDELAVRVFIADIAKVAARHLRGITVLYSISAGDHFLVVVRVTKNNKSAISSIENCRSILHCLMCEERIVCPQTNSPVERPYSQLPCDCKTKHPGKTAVILGPLWVGEIFSVGFIERLQTKTKDISTEIGIKLRTFLNSLLEEALCRGEAQQSVISENTETVTKHSNVSNNGDSCEPAKKKQKLENGGESASEIQERITNTEKESDLKNVQSVANAKTLIHEQGGTNMPLFYYNIQTKKYRILPKLDKLVIMLRAAGYRACRTHFQDHAVRTSANLSQLNEVVHKLAKK